MAFQKGHTLGFTKGHTRGFQKGQSGNPGGRAKGLEALAREKTRDGRVLIAFWLSVFAGKPIKRAIRLRSAITPENPLGRVQIEMPPTLEEMMKAAEWLADRGWGKAPQALEHSGPNGGPIQFDADGARARLAEQVERLLTTAALTSGSEPA
jgi:hypothetical protein